MKYNIILKIYWRSEIILADGDMFFSEFIVLAAGGWRYILQKYNINYKLYNF